MGFCKHAINVCEMFVEMKSRLRGLWYSGSGVLVATAIRWTGCRYGFECKHVEWLCMCNPSSSCFQCVAKIHTAVACTQSQSQ